MISLAVNMSFLTCLRRRWLVITTQKTNQPSRLRASGHDRCWDVIHIKCRPLYAFSPPCIVITAETKR
jgi:hypothetical protein